MKRFMVVTKIYGDCMTVFFHTWEAAQQVAEYFKTQFREQTEIYEYHNAKGYQRIEQEGENENVQI